MSTHIFDHIHEWRCRCHLIKAPIPNNVLADWFVKLFLQVIAKDVALSGEVYEEKVIMRAQHLDLIYSQSWVLYEIFPNEPRSNTDPTKLSPGPHADGVIGSVENFTIEKVTNQIRQMYLPMNTPVANQNHVPPTNPN